MAVVVLVFLVVIVVAIVTAAHSQSGARRSHPEPRELVRHALAVVPALDEHGSVRRTIERLTGDGRRIDVVVVTPAVAGRPAVERLSPRVTVCRVAGPRGAAEALAVGAAHGLRLDYDAIIEVPVGGPPLESGVTALLDALDNGAHVAVASRHVPGSRVDACPWGRRQLSRQANRALRALTRVPLHDITGRVRAYRREAVELGVLRAAGAGCPYGLEVLLRCRQAGLCFAEVPLTTEGAAYATMSVSDARAAVRQALRWRGRALRGVLQPLNAMFGTR